MKYYFNMNVFYVKGYKNAAIYDTNNDKVYSVDNYGREIIEKMMSSEIITLDVEKEYLEELKKLGLISETKNTLFNKNFEKPKARLRYAWLEITEACTIWTSNNR